MILDHGVSLHTSCLQGTSLLHLYHFSLLFQNICPKISIDMNYVSSAGNMLLTYAVSILAFNILYHFYMYPECELNTANITQAKGTLFCCSNCEVNVAFVDIHNILALGRMQRKCPVHSIRGDQSHFLQVIASGRTTSCLVSHYCQISHLVFVIHQALMQHDCPAVSLHVCLPIVQCPSGYSYWQLPVLLFFTFKAMYRTVFLYPQ